MNQMFFTDWGPRVKRWAADHAFTLIFLTIMFFITWSIELFFD